MTETTPPSRSPFLPARGPNWLAAGALGIGLWHLAGGVSSPSPATLLSIVILCLGGLYLVLEGFRSFSSVEAFSRRFALPATLAVGLAVVLFLGEHSLRYLAFPYPLDDGEGFCLNQGLRAASGLPLYPPLGPPPTSSQITLQFSRSYWDCSPILTPSVSSQDG